MIQIETIDNADSHAANGTAFNAENFGRAPALAGDEHDVADTGVGKATGPAATVGAGEFTTGIGAAIADAIGAETTVVSPGPEPLRK